MKRKKIGVGLLSLEGEGGTKCRVRGKGNELFLSTPSWGRGFTLLEVLVVVLIIAVLAAIALPMYQKAVQKSRFTALMPIAKSLSDSNEVYYLEHGVYANEPDQLVVAGAKNYTDGTSISMSGDYDHAYVQAKKNGLNNTYVIYQNHSINYPGEVHCEALEGDNIAEGVCVAVGGVENIGQTLTKKYTTYVLRGTGDGYPPGYTNILDCSKARKAGYSCEAEEDENGIKTRKVCKDEVCLISTYNADDKVTKRITCLPQNDGSCTNKEIWFYDENGRLKTTYVTTGGDNLTYTYDKDGRKTGQFACNDINLTDGSCRYLRGGSNSFTWEYDTDGNLIRERGCNSVSNGACASTGSSHDYSYDENNRLIAKVTCSSGPVASNCTGGTKEMYEYGPNGKVSSVTQCTIKSDGSCDTYKDPAYVYTYDPVSGNMTEAYNCRSVNSGDGSCARPNYKSEYMYDTAGHIIASYTCNASSLTDTCSLNGSHDKYAYTTDSQGRVTSVRVCDSLNSDGTCNTYDWSQTYHMRDFEYDANGNLTRVKTCNSTGCSTYSNPIDLIYSEEGILIGSRTCSNADCTEYSYTQYNPVENDSTLEGYLASARLGLPKY